MARPSDIKKKRKLKEVQVEPTYIPPEDNTNFAEASDALASAGYRVVKENGVMMVLVDKKDYGDKTEAASRLRDKFKEVLNIARKEGYVRSIGIRYSEGE